MSKKLDIKQYIWYDSISLLSIEKKILQGQKTSVGGGKRLCGVMEMFSLGIVVLATLIIHLSLHIKLYTEKSEI